MAGTGAASGDEEDRVIAEGTVTLATLARGDSSTVGRLASIISTAPRIFGVAIVSSRDFACCKFR